MKKLNEKIKDEIKHLKKNMMIKLMLLQLKLRNKNIFI